MEDMITVIVPVYKIKEALLRACIESLIEQNRDDYRVILVDDGSPDRCGDICDEYALHNNVISVLHQKNMGVSVARNSGIKATTTKWLAFVDADDWVSNNYISALYDVISSKAMCADIIMYGYVREYRESQSGETLGVKEGFLKGEDLNIVQQTPFYKLIQNGKGNPYTVIGIWDKIYRTDFLKTKNLWFIPEARKGQDRLFNADALNSTDKIFYFDDILYHYRCWGESRTNRYDPNIIALTEIEINELQKQMERHNLDLQVKEYMNCRVCTRLYSCMRLYFFNDLNPDSYRVRINKVKSLIDEEPFKGALAKVKMNLLSSDEKLFVFCIKAHLYRILYTMVRMRSRTKNNRLS